MNSIIWKGVSSTTIKGLLISELPPISRPAMRVKETTIDGRDGSILEDLGYSSYDKEVVIGLYGNFDINKVIKYFTGEGEVVFSNEPDKVYTAKIVGHIDYNRLLRYRQATIPFRVQPFKHKLFEAYKETQTSAASGSPLYIGDIYKFTSLKVDGAGGTIKTVGKNLFDYKSFLSASNGGLTNVLNEDGSITTSGVLTTDYASVVYCDITSRLVSGHSYTISQKMLSPKVYMQLNIRNKETGETEYVYLSNKQKDTFVADTATNKYELIIQSAAMKNFGSENVSITNYYQLEEGTSATEFEPYESSIYEYKTGEELSKNVTIFPPKSTLFNSNNEIMNAEYIKPYEVFNEGLETSKPIMVLKGEGTVVISVNGLEIFQYTFPEGENEVVIDSEKEDAYLGDVLKNRNMNGEFPVLLSGTNIIEWSGYVSSIEILPRSRWL